MAREYGAVVEMNPYEAPGSEVSRLSDDGQFRIIPRDNPKKQIPRLAALLAILTAVCYWKGSWELLIAASSFFAICLPLFYLVSRQHGRWVSSNLPGLPGGARYGGRVESQTRSGTRDGYLFACPAALFFSWHPWKPEVPFTRYDFSHLEKVEQRRGEAL